MSEKNRNKKNRNKGNAGRDGQPTGSAAAGRAGAGPSTGLQQTASQAVAAAQQKTASQPKVAELRPLRKDQQRALLAYGWAEAATKAKGGLGDYEIAVQSFAATLMRSGFAAAVSVLERSADRGGFALLLDNLASYALPGIAATAAAEWPGQVRALADIGQYMQATRELIALLGWLHRACRALGVEKAPQAEPTG